MYFRYSYLNQNKKQNQNRITFFINYYLYMFYLIYKAVLSCVLIKVIFTRLCGQATCLLETAIAPFALDILCCDFLALLLRSLYSCLTYNCLTCGTCLIEYLSQSLRLTGWLTNSLRDLFLGRLNESNFSGHVLASMKLCIFV